MALIAVSFTVEIILLIVSLYLGFDSGFLRKLVAIGFNIFGINLVLQKQFYVSDLSAAPVVVSSSFPGAIQNVMTIVFAFLTLVILAAAFVDLALFNEAEKIEEKLEHLV